VRWPFLHPLRDRGDRRVTAGDDGEGAAGRGAAVAGFEVFGGWSGPEDDARDGFDEEVVRGTGMDAGDAGDADQNRPGVAGVDVGAETEEGAAALVDRIAGDLPDFGLGEEIDAGVR
jgi:hypothetical protein